MSLQLYTRLAMPFKLYHKQLSVKNTMKIISHRAYTKQNKVL